MNQNLDLIWAAHATESTGRHYVNSIISLSLSQPHREFSSSLLFSFWGGRISSPHVLWPFTGSSRSPWRPTARRERERYIVVDPRTFACREKTGDKCLHKNRRRKNSMTQRERLLFFLYFLFVLSAERIPVLAILAPNVSACLREYPTRALLPAG